MCDCVCLQGGGAPESEADARQRARRTRVLLSNFALLRGKLGAPHPAWVLVNPLVQLPVFMALGGGLRLMAARSWPGLSTGGALWFPDLTQVRFCASLTHLVDGKGRGRVWAGRHACLNGARHSSVWHKGSVASRALVACVMAQVALVPGSLWWALPPGVDPTPWVMPLGPLGAVLPLALLGMMLTSLRIGFGAAGQAPADDAFGERLCSPPDPLHAPFYSL